MFPARSLCPRLVEKPLGRVGDDPARGQIDGGNGGLGEGQKHGGALSRAADLQEQADRQRERARDSGQRDPVSPTGQPSPEKGLDAVVTNAINGLNAMPPKGMCFDCTDADLRAIVEYMIASSE